MNQQQIETVENATAIKYGSSALARAVIIVNMPDYDSAGNPVLHEGDINTLAGLLLDVQGDIARIKEQLEECRQAAFDTGRVVGAVVGELGY